MELYSRMVNHKTMACNKEDVCSRRNWKARLIAWRCKFRNWNNPCKNAIRRIETSPQKRTLLKPVIRRSLVICRSSLRGNKIPNHMSTVYDEISKRKRTDLPLSPVLQCGSVLVGPGELCSHEKHPQFILLHSWNKVIRTQRISEWA